MTRRRRLNAPDPARIATATPPPPPLSLPPVARSAADAAAAAALADLGSLVSDARAEGRLLERVALEAIDTDYLIRDRMHVDADELEALVVSVRARGQTTPIEVHDLGRDPPRYGLISGWRRVLALKRLAATSPARFGTAIARVIPPREVPALRAAYVAMVEENEIRVGLSPFERARIVVRACTAAREGAAVFDSDRAALQTLFASLSPARRSRIGAFMTVVRDLGAHLRFPAALSERQGLALARALKADPGLGARVCAALAQAGPHDAAAEAGVLARVLGAGVSVTPAGGGPALGSAPGHVPAPAPGDAPPPAHGAQDRQDDHNGPDRAAGVPPPGVRTAHDGVADPADAAGPTARDGATGPTDTAQVTGAAGPTAPAPAATERLPDRLYPSVPFEKYRLDYDRGGKRLAISGWLVDDALHDALAAFVKDFAAQRGRHRP